MHKYDNESMYHRPVLEIIEDFAFWPDCVKQMMIDMHILNADLMPTELFVRLGFFGIGLAEDNEPMKKHTTEYCTYIENNGNVAFAYQRGYHLIDWLCNMSNMETELHPSIEFILWMKGETFHPQ